MIRHSLIIQVYNHERYIAQSLDSVLNQKVLPDEIIIGDDCSVDNSPEIIERYIAKYPLLIHFYRQPVNLGIYPHLQFLCSKVTGDIISIISADDYLVGDMFAEFNRIVECENLNPSMDNFILAANHWNLAPDGKMTIFNNSHVSLNSLFGERLRYGVSYRDCGLSRKLFQSLGTIDSQAGILADWLIGFDHVVNCERFVFIPKAFYVYRVGIGAATRASRYEIAISGLYVINKVEEKYHNRLRLSDKLYIKYLKSKFNFEITQSWFNYLIFIVWTSLNCWNFSKANPFSQNLRAYTFILKKIFGERLPNST